MRLRLQQRGQAVLDQLIHAHAGGVDADVHRGDDVAAVVLQRQGDGAQAQLKLLVDAGIAERAGAGDFDTQPFGVDDGVRGDP